MITCLKTPTKQRVPAWKRHITTCIRAEETNSVLVNQTKFLQGVVEAPPSKSYTQRAIMLGALNGEVKIVNPLLSCDSLAAMGAWSQLGAHIHVDERTNNLLIKGVSGRPHPKDYTINVKESGTFLKFVLPMLALAKGDFTVTGEKTLLDRPNQAIVEALRKWNIDINGQGPWHKLPISIKGVGEIKGGKTEINGREGSQVVSSLLIAASWAKEDTTIIVKDRLVSRPYVDITIDALRKAGINVERDGFKKFTIKRNQSFELKEDFVIPGDYSSAAFLIAAACLVPSDVTISRLSDDAQGDKRIIKILNSMGAKIEHDKDSVRIKGPFELRGVDFDGGDIPDIVPILTAVACFAKGKTRITNIGHLKHKESNRIKSPARELCKLGAEIITDDNSIEVSHSVLSPGAVVSCGDHRIAMLLTVVGLRTGGMKIADTGCITKSYPSFFKDMRSLGANIVVS